MPDKTTEIVREIGALKTGLNKVITAEIARFKQATGFTPSDVSVHVAEVTSVRDSVKQYAISAVDLRFEF